ncbi:hypothetical protein J416_11832, partial [Gracilibacillus halophilus YIM-C55.5]
VAVEFPDVRAVTYNPALLPEHVVDKDKDYNNITNYLGKYDILTGSLMSLNYDDRIPGAKHEIHNGIPAAARPFSTIGSNHTGYLRNGGDQYYNIRPDGGPGSGKIYIEADEHIVTSIWTGQPLYGDPHQIDITPEALEVLANGLEDAVIDRLSKVKNYLDNSMEIIQDERAKRRARINKMQEAFDEIVVEEIGNSLFEDITWMGNQLKSELRWLHSLLDLIEQKGQSLNYVLNSPPAELIEFITRQNVDVSTLVDQARRKLHNLEENVDDLTDNFRLIITEKIPELLHTGFHVGTELWYDTVVEEMHAHFNIVQSNHDKIQQQINRFKHQVYETANHFTTTDKSIADAITNKQNIPSHTAVATASEKITLEQSPYLKTRMRIKEIQLDASYTFFKTAIHVTIAPIVGVLHDIIWVIKTSLENLSEAVKGAPNIYFNYSLPGFLISYFTNYQEQVQAIVNAMVSPIDTFISRIDGIRDGLSRLENNIPVILERFRPYIEHALFDNQRYSDVYLYNHASLSLLKEIDLLFHDINHQLADEKAKAIDELVLNGEEIDKKNSLLSEQIERGTLY